MKYYELDTSEKEILKDFEKESFKSVPKKQLEIRRYRTYAKSTLTKQRNINIRLSDRDLQKMKAKAAEKGIQYQTLVSSILHEYTSR